MIKTTSDAPLLAHNTFGMDVRAAMLAEYETNEELHQILTDVTIQRLMQAERQQGRLPFWHIGAGSNLLFRADYPGVILHCTRRGMHLVMSDNENCLLEVEAGTLWDDVCDFCAKHQLYGTENLSLIPGETGAAAVQNIGAYGVEIADLVHKVVCWDVEKQCTCDFTAAEMQYGYRESLLKHPEAKSRYIVCQVVLRLTTRPTLHLDYAGLNKALSDTLSPTASDVRTAVIRIREGKLPDPKVLGNAGSFFKNPVIDNALFERLLSEYPTMPHYFVDSCHTKIPAGWLIEQCGWKGKKLGRAGVYERQSLVLVNLGGALPTEITTLCDTIVSDVYQKFGITISPEVNLI